MTVTRQLPSGLYTVTAVVMLRGDDGEAVVTRDGVPPATLRLVCVRPSARIHRWRWISPISGARIGKIYLDPRTGRWGSPADLKLIYLSRRQAHPARSWERFMKQQGIIAEGGAAATLFRKEIWPSNRGRDGGPAERAGTTTAP